MTTKKHSFLKIALCLILVLAIFPIAKISTVFAETLTLKTLISDHSEQEITSSLDINTNFENGSTLNGSGTASWGTPTIGSATITQVNVADLTKDEYIGYKTENDVKYSSIGTDGITGNQFGLLFKLSESGVAGIESTEIKIPAHAYYVLSFNLAIPALDNTLTQQGFNAKLIHEDKNGETVTTALKTIKSKNKSYVSYAFLIQGNENVEKTVKLQFLLGNAVVDDKGELTESKQIGYAVVDTIRMFSVTHAQFEDLSEDKNCQEVSLLDQDSNYVSIKNGFFNETDNKSWNLSANTKLSDFAPLNWKHSGTSNEFGVINTNNKLFEERLTQSGLSSVNPGNANGWETTKFNNVLMLSNPTEAHQKLTSEQFVLSKNSYYRISFSFNTPATEGQTNGISFSIVDNDNKTIYSQDKIYSYTEYKDDANVWATFNLFVETDSAEKKVNFIINFGTESNMAKGNAFVDEISLTKVSAATAFANTEENKYPLTTEEGEDQKFLEKGIVSFENLKELDTKNSSNRSLSLFSYKKVEESTTDKNESTTNKDSETEAEENSNPALVWYVVPSVLLGACLIGGMAIYYAKKIKIKKAKNNKPAKTTYDRKRTLNKQVEKREKEQSETLKQEYEIQLQQVQKEIEKLEENYKKQKQNKHTLQAYLSKRQKLEAKESKIKDQIDRLK